MSIKKLGKFNVLYDSDHGSSGKGAAVTRIAQLTKVQNVSCNHGPNAGHVVEKETGERLLMKILPSPCALNKFLGLGAPRAWIGPNSAFELATLENERFNTGYADMSHGFRHSTGELIIHGRAALTEKHHKDMEGPAGSMSTLHISSTMSGAGATYASKAMRQLSTKLAEEIVGMPTKSPEEFYWAVQDNLAIGQDFLHEVAQGFALSLDYGNHTRHGTFRNPTALQAAADFGIRGEQMGNVYCNLRTFPIRVGNNFADNGKRLGYSGDWFDDQVELDWRTIGANAGMPEDEIQALFSKELTTVTKKLRRVASFSKHSLRYSTAFNGATHLVLNFTCYLDWASTDKRGGKKEYSELSKVIHKFVDELESEVNLPVVMVGTGAKHESFILPYDDINYKR